MIYITSYSYISVVLHLIPIIIMKSYYCSVAQVYIFLDVLRFPVAMHMLYSVALLFFCYSKLAVHFCGLTERRYNVEYFIWNQETHIKSFRHSIFTYNIAMSCLTMYLIRTTFMSSINVLQMWKPTGCAVTRPQWHHYPSFVDVIVRDMAGYG